MFATILQHPGRRPTVGRALAITATFAFGWVAASPASGWLPIGPSGGTFSSVAGTTNLAAATYSGVIWHSTDDGLYWELAGSLAGDQPWAAATRLAGSAIQAADLYASTQSGAFTPELTPHRRRAGAWSARRRSRPSRADGAFRPSTSSRLSRRPSSVG